MEAGGAVEVELMRVQGLAHSNDAWVGGLVLEKSNAFKFFAANQDVGHAGKLFALGLGQVRAVDDPVVVHTPVEAVLLARAVGNHLSALSFLPDTGWGFLSIEPSLTAAAAFSTAAAAAALPFCAKAMPPPRLPPPGWRCW
jgi:hypothetical protein